MHSIKSGDTHENVKLWKDAEDLDGDPLTEFGTYRLSWEKKEALATLSTETLYLRSPTAWFKSDAPLFAAGFSAACPDSPTASPSSAAPRRP